MDENAGQLETAPKPKPKRAPRKKPFWERVKKHWLLTVAGILATTLVILSNAPGAVETISMGFKMLIQWAPGA